MNKRYWHHVWTRFRQVKPWYFLILCVISSGISVYALRANNIHMLQLKNAVFAADKSGKDVDQALQNLQAYVTAHMNTALSSGPEAVYPPIQLKYTYERLVNAQKPASTNSQLYTNAENYCQALIPTGFSGRYRISCVENYIQTHGIGQKVASQPIPPSLYEFDFVAPWWSPDLAGWSLLASILLLVLFIVSFIAERLIKKAAS